MKISMKSAGMMLAAASVVALGSPNVAGADTTRGDHSVLGGNQVHAPVSIPVNACGNAIAVLGQAAAECAGSAEVIGGGHSHSYTRGDRSIAGGNQVHAPVSAPVNACGNSVSVGGQAAARCKGHAVVRGGHSCGCHAHHVTRHTVVTEHKSVTREQPAAKTEAKPAAVRQAPQVKTAKSLPFTGANTGALAGIGIAALVAGAAAIFAASRKLRLGRR